MPLTRDWAKSSYSDPNGGNCVEARRSLIDAVQIRDSKNPDNSVLTVSADSWQEFIRTLKTSSPL